MIFVLAADKWPGPTRTTLVSGPEGDPTRARKEFFVAKESSLHPGGQPVLLYFNVNPQSVSIARYSEPKTSDSKGKSK